MSSLIIPSPPCGRHPTDPSRNLQPPHSSDSPVKLIPAANWRGRQQDSGVLASASSSNPPANVNKSFRGKWPKNVWAISLFQHRPLIVSSSRTELHPAKRPMPPQEHGPLRGILEAPLIMGAKQEAVCHGTAACSAPWRVWRDARSPVRTVPRKSKTDSDGRSAVPGAKLLFHPSGSWGGKR